MNRDDKADYYNWLQKKYTSTENQMKLIPKLTIEEQSRNVNMVEYSEENQRKINEFKKILAGIATIDEIIVEEPNYKWEVLANSIKRKGIKKPLLVKEFLDVKGSFKNPIQYKLLDGHHRAFVLHQLYGEEYKVKCKVYNELYQDSLLTNNQSKFRRKGFWASKENHAIDEVNRIKHELKEGMYRERSKLHSKYKLNVTVNKKD